MPTSEMSNELKAALDAARAAAEVIRGFYQRNVKIEVKADKTPVTEADVRSEEAIRELLTRRFPTYGFYGEETGKSDMNAESVWLVDPIDGTKSFVRECPFFSTQIALMRAGRFVLGVSSAPAYNELAWAEKGRGAWLNERRLRVSSRRDLSECLIGTGIPHCGRGAPEAWAKIYDAVGSQVSGIRRFGAASLDLAWVAAGRMDGFWEDDLDIWDTAAGLLLIREAGGFVTDYRGSDRSFERREYVAGSAAIHSKLQKLVAGAVR